MKPATVLTWIVAAVLAILALFAWEAAATGSQQTAFFFSSPSQVAGALARGADSGVLPTDFIASAKATVLGLLLGAAIGCVIGLVGLAAPAATSLVRVVVLTLAALPVLAIAPMFLIWFGVGPAMKIAIATTLCATVFASQVLTIPSAVSPDLRAFLQSNGVSFRQQLGKVLGPLGVEHVLKVMPAAANAAFLGVFVGEFVAADRGIGYRILRAGALYRVDVVLAQTVAALALLLLLQLASHVSRRSGASLAQRASLAPVLRQGRSA